MRIYSRRQREIEKEKEDEEKENCALSLSLSSAVRYKHSLAHARASERAFEKNVARGKGDGAFQNFEITPNSFSVVFFCDLTTFYNHKCWFSSHANQKTKKKTRTTNLPDDLQP